MTPSEFVRKTWPNAKVIKGREFENAPDEFTYISTRHQFNPDSGMRGGRLIGRGDNARQAWADAAARVRAEKKKKKQKRRIDSSAKTP